MKNKCHGYDSFDSILGQYDRLYCVGSQKEPQQPNRGFEIRISDLTTIVLEPIRQYDTVQDAVQGLIIN